MITLSWFPPLLYILFTLAILWFLSVIGPFFFGAPWVPMSLEQARRILQLAELRSGETVYDLGSGDGRVLILAAREFGAKGIGIEIEPLRAFFSRVTILFLGLQSQIRIIRANFFEINLGPANVVTLYLLPRAIARLTPQLRRDLKPGARVVSLTYPIPGWEPVIEEGGVRLYRL